MELAAIDSDRNAVFRLSSPANAVAPMSEILLVLSSRVARQVLASSAMIMGSKPASPRVGN